MALINTTTTGVLGTTLFGDGNGDLTVQKDGVTINKITKCPTFYAYMNTTDTFSYTQGAWTKVPLDTKQFDTDSCFNTSSYRFLPNVAGYYQINSHIQFETATSVSGYNYLAIYKNGSVYAYLASVRIKSGQSEGDTTLSGSVMVYCNGTTDYIELYAYQDSASTALLRKGSTRAHLSGHLARAD